MAPRAWHSHDVSDPGSKLPTCSLALHAWPTTERGTTAVRGVQVHADERMWEVQRRYSDFHELHLRLIKVRSAPRRPCTHQSMPAHFPCALGAGVRRGVPAGAAAEAPDELRR